MKNKNSEGFTLLEISIVLVVIGFILGVVLFGQDIINQARIRSIATQLERYNAAANTFRDKYGQLPGDISRLPKNLGFFSTPGLLNTLGGDGDNYIQPAQEIANFYHHMSVLTLIDFYGDGTTTLSPVGKSIPYVKGSSRGGMRVYTGFRTSPADAATIGMFINAYHLGVVNGGSNFENIFTPRDAFNLDTKLDDGMPNTGSVQAYIGADITSVFTAENNPSRTINTAGTPSCIEGATPATTFTRADVYKIRGNSVQCQLRIKAGF